MASFASFSVPDNHAHIPEGSFAPVLYGGNLPYELPSDGKTISASVGGKPKNLVPHEVSVLFHNFKDPCKSYFLLSKLNSRIKN